MTWRSPGELVEIGFRASRVVMANEAHSGFARCIRTRRVGLEIVTAAHAGGCRHLAMEALRNERAGAAFSRVAPDPSGYLGHPEMRALTDHALALGWTLVSYEQAAADMARTYEVRQSMDDVNDREQAQADHLVEALDHLDGAPLLVWVGNGHLYKRSPTDWKPMGMRLAEASGLDPYCIDQTVTVTWGAGQRSLIELRPEIAEPLSAIGGTAGFTADDPPPGRWVPEWLGVDALVLSLDNELVGDAEDFSQPRSA